MASGAPVKKIAQQPQPGFLTFFRMELCADDIVAADHRRQPPAILNRRHHRIIGPTAKREAMDKISMRTRRYAGQNRMLVRNNRKLVPPHMGYLECLVDRIKGRYFTADPAKPVMPAMFDAMRRQKLHANADSEKGPSLPKHRFGQGIAHAGQAIQPREAVAKGANAGQNNSIGAAQQIGIARNLNVSIAIGRRGGALDRLRDRAQIS